MQVSSGVERFGRLRGGAVGEADGVVQLVGGGFVYRSKQKS